MGARGDSPGVTRAPGRELAREVVERALRQARGDFQRRAVRGEEAQARRLSIGLGWRLRARERDSLRALLGRLRAAGVPAEVAPLYGDGEQLVLGTAPATLAGAAREGVAMGLGPGKREPLFARDLGAAAARLDAAERWGDAEKLASAETWARERLLVAAREVAARKGWRATEALRAIVAAWDACGGDPEELRAELAAAALVAGEGW